MLRDINVPFQLKDGVRQENTQLKEALREAFVNAIIHADFTGSASLQILRMPNSFEFRNPGTMRVSVEEAIHGGISDCRNRHLQKMFRLIGVGEQAGSGIPSIFKAWNDQHWQTPRLSERCNPPEAVTLVLTMQHEKVPDEEVLPQTSLWKEALRFAEPVRKSQRVNRNEIVDAILKIASLGFVSAQNLATLLKREKTSLQNHYLGSLVKEEKLFLRDPKHPKSAHQAYSVSKPTSL